MKNAATIPALNHVEGVHFRTPDVWKIRWCGRCGRYEFDAGVPRGWVTLQGDPPARDVRLGVMLDVA